ncbi:MAG: hypothetical protein JXR95_10580 [Deltaproteobacteria bacterium]|nr:hypothetical protein [Deltaproteobacteria bacterium]
MSDSKEYKLFITLCETLINANTTCNVEEINMVFKHHVFSRFLKHILYSFAMNTFPDIVTQYNITEGILYSECYLWFRKFCEEGKEIVGQNGAASLINLFKQTCRSVVRKIQSGVNPGSFMKKFESGKNEESNMKSEEVEIPEPENPESSRKSNVYQTFPVPDIENYQKMENSTEEEVSERKEYQHLMELLKKELGDEKFKFFLNYIVDGEKFEFGVGTKEYQAISQRKSRLKKEVKVIVNDFRKRSVV